MAFRVTINGLDTAKLPSYKNKELEEMLVLIKQGDRDTREKFLMGNVRLVLCIVQRFRRCKENPDDLFQVGMLGLVKATDNFDIKYGVRFSTYAVPMIEGEIRRYVRESTALKVGRSIRDTAYKALKARETLEQTATKEVTITDVAEAVNLPIDEVVASLDAIAEPVSLYSCISEEGDYQVVDRLGDYDAEERLMDKLTLRYAIKSLPKKEQDILTMRYYQGLTQMEISSALDMSQAQVSRLEKTAIAKLRENF